MALVLTLAIIQRTPGRGGMETAVLDTLSVDELIAAIDVNFNEAFPEEALRAIQQRPTEFTPRLIDLIETATRAARDGGRLDSSGYIAALFLLTQFRSREALPTIVDSLMVPKDALWELWGDMLTEDFGKVLSELAADMPAVIDRIIIDPSIDQFARWQAAHTFFFAVRDRLMTREEAVERLRQYLIRAIESRDEMLATQLVAELCGYVPTEALTEIREAFARGLVDEFFIQMCDVEYELNFGPGRFNENLNQCPPTGCCDAVAELKTWFVDLPRAMNDWSDDFEPLSLVSPLVDLVGHRHGPSSLLNSEIKVGRNDPCLCGSGKKYKKCCGRQKS